MRFAYKITVAAGIIALAAAAQFGFAQHLGIAAPKASFAASSAETPFELFRGNRIFLPATINGHDTTVMLDSGASTTTVDRAFARSIGLPEGQKIHGQGTGGAVEAELVRGITLAVGGLRFTDMSVGVMDLQPVARGIGHPISVILGRELFDSAVVSIDWQNNRLWIRSAAGFTAPKGSVEVKLGQTGPFRTVPVKVGDKAIDAFLDLGNGGNLIVAKDDWNDTPSIAAIPGAEIVGGGVGGLHPLRAVTFPTVTYAGHSFSRVPGALNMVSQPNKATHITNAGIGFLKQFHVDLDFGNDRMFLRPRSDPPGFERDRSGSRFDFLGDRLKVTFVSPQGPAQAAGLRTGDEVVAVNGVKVGPGYYNRADWTRGAAGTVVQLDRTTGGPVTITLRDFY